MNSLRYLLLQIRDHDDPIREQEIVCFQCALDCEPAQLETLDLLALSPDESVYDRFDAVFIGGSGNYSAAGESEWLDRTLASLRVLLEMRKPTFASCWGFQAFARAAGGRCINDPQHAELGTIKLELTDAGASDPLFGSLPRTFVGQAGHEDHVVELPPGAVLLASSRTVANQAFRFADAPIYCTQFSSGVGQDCLGGPIGELPAVRRADCGHNSCRLCGYLSRCTGDESAARAVH